MTSLSTVQIFIDFRVFDFCGVTSYFLSQGFRQICLLHSIEQLVLPSSSWANVLDKSSNSIHYNRLLCWLIFGVAVLWHLLPHGSTFQMSLSLRSVLKMGTGCQTFPLFKLPGFKESYVVFLWLFDFYLLFFLAITFQTDLPPWDLPCRWKLRLSKTLTPRSGKRFNTYPKNQPTQ